MIVVECHCVSHGRSNTGDLVIEITIELCSTDLVKWRYVTTTQQLIQREAQLTLGRLFGIHLHLPELRIILLLQCMILMYQSVAAAYVQRTQANCSNSPTVHFV